MAKEKPKPPPKPEPLNEEVMKGIWVDGIGFWAGRDYVIMEGIITKPRTKKNLIVSRIMFPPRILETLAHSLNELVEKRKELERGEKKSAKE